MSQNTPNKTHRTGMGSNLDQERKEVCKQELIIVETYTSFNLHNAYYIITIPITIFYILILTYLLTPWSRVLLEKLAGLQLVKKFPAFYGTRRFLTAHTSALHLSLSWARPIQSSYPNPTSWRSILILSSHRESCLQKYNKLNKSHLVGQLLNSVKIRFSGCSEKASRRWLYRGACAVWSYVCRWHASDHCKLLRQVILIKNWSDYFSPIR